MVERWRKYNVIKSLKSLVLKLSCLTWSTWLVVLCALGVFLGVFQLPELILKSAHPIIPEIVTTWDLPLFIALILLSVISFVISAEVTADLVVKQQVQVAKVTTASFTVNVLYTSSFIVILLATTFVRTTQVDFLQQLLTLFPLSSRLSLALLEPIAVEVIFRGLIQNIGQTNDLVKRSYPYQMGLSSLLSAGLMVWSWSWPLFLINALAQGLFASYYGISHNLKLVILAHCLFNIGIIVILG